MPSVEPWRFEDVDAMRVCIISARGLMKKGLTQPGSNCFVTTRLGLNRSMDSPIVPNSTEPVWNEEYHLKWMPGYDQHRYLNMDVMHKDLIKRKHLGSIIIDLSAALNDSHERSHVQWYPLQAIASSKDQSCDRGQIYVSILRYPSHRRFRLPPAVDERLPDAPPSVVGAAASHTFKLVHLIKPTWCDVCDKFIFGVFNPQAYRCVECELTSHNDCIKACRVACDQRRSRRSHSQ